MAKSPSEQIRALEGQLATLTERLDNTRRENEELKQAITRLEERIARYDEKQNAAATKGELTQQRLDDHIRRVEVWEGRGWGLLMLMAGALLSLASGLIVTLVTK